MYIWNCQDLKRVLIAKEKGRYMDIMKKLQEDANQGSLFSKHTLDNEDLSTLTGFAEAIIKQDTFVKELEERLKEEKRSC